ncbi:MAG: hypothetical protein QW772_02375 [Zestosphaera sp.]
MSATRVELIGFDSLGIRSMATFLETSDIALFIDPAVSIAPMRYGLPPHEVELKRLEEVATRIATRAYESEVIVITHYHYDHHDLGELVPIDIYKGKTLLIKDPKNNINLSQRVRASKFLKRVAGLPKEVKVADSSISTYGGTRLLISRPTPHGPSPRLGYVVQVFVEDAEGSVLHTSDVEGPVNDDALSFMVENPADLIIVDGPPTYLFGLKRDVSDPNTAILKLSTYLSHNAPEFLVLDHHMLRDLNYGEFFRRLSPHLRGTKLLTAAEFMGREPELLEAGRKDLYGV